jgi:Transposase, Mutator family
VNWLRHKHPKRNWAWLRRRHLPGWWPTDGELKLFNSGRCTRHTVPLPGESHPLALGGNDDEIGNVVPWRERVESRMRCKAHVRFGGRAGETERQKRRHRAPVPTYHFNIRLEEDRLCCLVLLGVRADGHKELVAVGDGFRESTESWAEVLRDLKRRGMRAPMLAELGARPRANQSTWVEGPVESTQRTAATKSAATRPARRSLDKITHRHRTTVGFRAISTPNAGRT